MNDTPRQSRRTYYLAIASVAIAVTIWVVYWVHGSRGFSAHEFTNTERIEVTDVATHRIRDGFRVQCQITNHAQHTAAQIVFTARIVDGQGRDIAVNPLVSISGLPPGATRSLEIVLPARMTSSGDGYDAVVMPTVVRWGD